MDIRLNDIIRLDKQMKSQIATGYDHANLTLDYEHHQKGTFKLKDLQVALAEFCGTFLLAFIIGATKNSPPGSQGIAIGFGLTALIYTFGKISGGQFNPAVSVGLVVRNKLSVFEASYIIVSQVVGAVCAGLACYTIYDYEWKHVGYPAINDTSRREAAFLAEFLQTFALVTAVLNCATTKDQANNSYFGLAIGFVVLSGALTVGNVSGACFNPAVAMLSVLNGSFKDLAVFILAPLLGGIAAALLFRGTQPNEMSDDDLVVSAVTKITKGHHNPDGNITRMLSMMIMEFIGTFMLTYIVALTVNAGVVGGMIAVGAILLSMVYAGGAVSGGHYNPCVTLAVYLRGLQEVPQGMMARDALLYVTVQLLAAFCGGGTAAFVQDGLDQIASPSVAAGHTQGAAMMAEFIFSTALCLAVLCTATNKKVSGNSFVGIAVGFTVMAGSITVANISGGVFNPAIGIALPAITDRSKNDIWVYVIGDLLGGGFAALLYTFLTYEHNIDFMEGTQPLFHSVE